MKRFIAAACVAAVLVSGCASTGGANARMSVGKGIADAWLALDGAAQGADIAWHAGVLKGAQAATVSRDLKTAQAALTAATAAYRANPDASAAGNIAVAAAAVAEVLTIVSQAQKGAS